MGILTGTVRVGVILGVFAMSLAASAQTAPPGIPVVVEQVTQQDVPLYLRGLGKVKSLRSVEIRSQIDGILERILVNEGQHVSRGDLLAELDDRSIRATLEQYKAQLVVAESQLDIAKLDLKRYQDLGKTQAVSAQTIDQQLAQVRQLEAQINSVKASIAAQEVELSFTRITSPVSGQVGIRNVDAGNYVRSGDTNGLFSVIQLDPISVEVSLPQSNLPQVQKLRDLLQQQQVPVSAFFNDGGELLAEGQLAVIDNQVSTTSGTIRVKADFSNAELKLWPNQSVVTSIQYQILENAIVIPAKALREGINGSYVWVNQAGKADIQPIQVLYPLGNIVVVTGIKAGEQVITDGYSRLRKGSGLQILQTSADNTAAVADRGSPL